MGRPRWYKKALINIYAELSDLPDQLEQELNPLNAGDSSFSVYSNKQGSQVANWIKNWTFIGLINAPKQPEELLFIKQKSTSD